MIAMRDFDGGGEGEGERDEELLSFKKGDKICVLSRESGVWWRGKKGQFEGYFPKSFIQRIEMYNHSYSGRLALHSTRSQNFSYSNKNRSISTSRSIVNSHSQNLSSLLASVNTSFSSLNTTNLRAFTSLKWDFEASTEKEISIRKGEVVEVLQIAQNAPFYLVRCRKGEKKRGGKEGKKRRGKERVGFVQKDYCSNIWWKSGAERKKKKLN